MILSLGFPDVIGSNSLDKGALSRLAGSRQKDYRRIGKRFQQRGGNMPLDHSQILAT